MQKSTASIVIIAGMTYLCAMLLTALPMLVCLFWAIFLLTNYVETRRPDKGRLTVFMLVATLLYGEHYVFFNRFIFPKKNKEDKIRPLCCLFDFVVEKSCYNYYN